MKSLIVGLKCGFKHQGLRMFGLKLKKNLNTLHPLEVVSRWRDSTSSGGKFKFDTLAH